VRKFDSCRGHSPEQAESPLFKRVAILSAARP
jgi:hypothetical protein